MKPLEAIETQNGWMIIDRPDNDLDTRSAFSVFVTAEDLAGYVLRWASSKVFVDTKLAGGAD